MTDTEGMTEERLAEIRAFSESKWSKAVVREMLTEIDRLRTALAAAREDAEAWRAFEELRNVSGASWSVRHPRPDKPNTFYVGFSWPMSHDAALLAVQRGGLGFAPDVATMLRNAVDALRATRPSPDTGRET